MKIHSVPTTASRTRTTPRESAPKHGRREGGELAEVSRTIRPISWCPVGGSRRPMMTSGLLPALLLLPLLLLHAPAGCGAERVARQSSGPTIMEQVDMPAMTRVMEARAAAADTTDAGRPAAADRDPAFAPPPSPLPQRPENRRKQPLQSSRRARYVTKKKYLKDDWCKMGEVMRVVREPGCRPEKIVDHFCYGQCNSFYIPRESNGRRRAFKSCPSCMPRRWERVTVNFKCSGKTRRRKKYRLVKQCRCMATRRR